MSQQGQLQNYSVDQVAGAIVLVLGAVASLLLVLWQSKCLCKVNLCYVFQCERRPPNEDEMKSLKDQRQALKDKDAKDAKALKETNSAPDVEEQIVPTPKKFKDINLEYQ
tara:strand:+ start:325 stop:654 length:330 start_codon:yes stop_codon:yes gene_type:complete